jgi:hypothetical protein
METNTPDNPGLPRHLDGEPLERRPGGRPSKRKQDPENENQVAPDKP